MLLWIDDKGNNMEILLKCTLENMDVYLNVVCCYCCLLFYYENSNKKELQQITVNHSWDIDFKNFTNLYKKFNAKPYSLIVVDTTLASDNTLHFRQNLLTTIQY